MTPLVVWLISFKLVYGGSVLDTDVVDCTSLLDPRHAIIHPHLSPQNKKGATRMLGFLQIRPSYKAKKKKKKKIKKKKKKIKIK